MSRATVAATDRYHLFTDDLEGGFHLEVEYAETETDSPEHYSHSRSATVRVRVDEAEFEALARAFLQEIERRRMYGTWKACTPSIPQCAGQSMHGECYGQPACPYGSFRAVDVMTGGS